MNNVCTMYLVRHGQSVSNRDGMVGGQTDYQLTDKGEEQARATKRELGSVHFDDVYSSDLHRAADTATIIMGKPVAPSHMLPALRERNFGSFEGRKHSEFAAVRESQRAKVHAMSSKQRWEYDYGVYMESNETLSNRILSALTAIGEANLGKTVLVGMHGGPIRTTLIRFGYAADESELPPGSFKNGGYVVLEFDGTRFAVKRVVGVNKREAYAE